MLPAENSSPRWRIATNAEAQNVSVTPTAARGSQVGGADVRPSVVVVTGQRYGQS